MNTIRKLEHDLKRDGILTGRSGETVVCANKRGESDYVVTRSKNGETEVEELESRYGAAVLFNRWTS